MWLIVPEASTEIRDFSLLSIELSDETVLNPEVASDISVYAYTVY